MVCVPCIVIPFVLWFFHKYIQPYVGKYIPWLKKEKSEVTDSGAPKTCPIGFGSKQGSVNGTVTTPEVTAGDSGGAGDKKNN